MRLAKAIRRDAPNSELAVGLDRFASAPVVTRETVATLAEVLATTINVAAEDRAAELRAAQQDVARACEQIDTPEQ